MHEWITGRNPVYEVLRAGRRTTFRLMLAEGVQQKGRLSDILAICQLKKIEIVQASRSRLDKLASGNQGVALEASQYPYSGLVDIFDLAESRGEPLFVLLLDTLQDPQNLGTLLRSAEIVGVHGVVLPYRRAASVTPAVVNASSGASEHLLIAQANLAQAIGTLKEKGAWVVGLESKPGAKDPGEVRLEGPLALVVGSEGEGMRPLVRSSCDWLLRLPMRGHVESLNAAVAGSVALYLAWQARSFAGAASR
ncbi:MAG TPA: 23S rRNA (guanosine(2251)-2'-O)-methyltransferase RlmB [Anaerolineales bacterium]|nr:23S rRNA (guanosine(2251)-2'-O)-methyltransferase RlmB [Anaerolineales bacterium]